MELIKHKISSKRIVHFFSKSNNTLVYYTPRFLKFLNSLMPKIKLEYYCLQNSKGEIIALMPVASKNILELGTIINSLPFFGSHGGIIYLNSEIDKLEIQHILIKALLEEIKNENVLSVTLVENPFEPLDKQLMQSLGFEIIDTRLGQFKNIGLQSFKEDLDVDLLMSFHTKTRNVVRKGLSFKPAFSEQNDFETICWIQSVHEKSISKLNGKFKSIDVFNHLLKTFPSPEYSRVFVCKKNGKNIAGLLVLLYDSTVEYFTPVIEEDYKDTQLLSALIYEAMKTLSREGFSTWNWGGTWISQEGVYRFKDRFGSYTKPYRYFSKIENKRIKEINREELTSQFNFFYSYKF